LTQDDAEALKEETSYVSTIASELTGRYQVTYKSNNSNVQVIGTEPSYAQIRNVSTSSGIFISEEANDNYSKVAVIGPTIQEELFGEEIDPVGATIKINKIQFKVIGVTTSKGGSGMNNSDNSIYIPIASAQRYLAGKTSISGIDIQAKDAESVDMAEQEVTNILLARHNISDSSSADFSITNQADIVSSLSSVTGTLTLMLGAIAGISLLVGGIGIMNMMLTTVTERTREIGLRKAIGATNGDIAIQFLSESVALTFIGGILGVFLGVILAALMTKFASITSTVTWQSIVLAFGVSALVGIIFGYYPSRRAAKLKPIEALRYE
jgi:putative ABC transport system permease protein